MADYDDDDMIPEAFPVDETPGWATVSGIPVDDNGVSVIPELVDRPPTHNESVLISGIPITMASSNVSEIWWTWQDEHGNYYPKLFVRFLDGSLYVYKDASLSVAVGMVETMSPGRYVWSVLRVGWPTETGAAERLIKGNSKGRKKAQGVRLVR